MKTYTREGHGDGEVDAVHGARIAAPPESGGYRYRVVRYCRAENADEWHALYAHEVDRRETAESQLSASQEKLRDAESRAEKAETLIAEARLYIAQAEILARAIDKQDH